MSLEGKAALKVEEVVINANGMSNLTKCGMPLTMLSCLLIIVNRNIDTLP